MRRRAGLALIAGGLAVLALRGGATAAPPPGYLGAFRWRMDDPRFGGLSAIHVYPGGTRFVVVSDRGSYSEGRLIRDAAGRIERIEAARFSLLRGAGEEPLAEGRNDSEGLAIARDGTAYVSFEGQGAARVLRYSRLDGPAENLPVHPDFRCMQLNSALEALAIGPDGALYTLPERSGALTRPFPVYRFRRGAWDRPFSLPRRGAFLPVAADVGPDGRFYLLERDFRGISGFASRLRRFDLAGGQEVTLFETPLGLHDNLEGLSVWRDGRARLVATLVSDDNFRFFQRTEIIEYALPD
ncbi:MAG: esterase-like activity of phytase family protein [Paracoccaceae bacterium]|nr:MAG: esterase-like activity of phytase family protein [Paracoccaceae bacterium]